MALLTEKTFSHGTLTLNYVEGPPGGTPLLLVHGATGRWQTFLPVIPSLLARYHVFALNLRGHGGSTPAPAGAYRLDDMTGDVVAFLRQQIGRPALLLGHSLGGVVVLATAAAVPDLVTAVVSEDPPLGQLVPGDPGRPPPIFASFHTIMTGDDDDDAKLAALQALTERDDAARVRNRLAQLQQCDMEFLRLVLAENIFLPHSLATLLPHVVCRVLLLQANPEMGGALSEATAAEVKAYLADCTHLYLPDATHSIHRMPTQRYVQIVTDFFESL